MSQADHAAVVSAFRGSCMGKEIKSVGFLWFVRQVPFFFFFIVYEIDKGPSLSEAGQSRCLLSSDILKIKYKRRCLQQKEKH